MDTTTIGTEDDPYSFVIPATIQIRVVAPTLDAAREVAATLQARMQKWEEVATVEGDFYEEPRDDGANTLDVTVYETFDDLRAEPITWEEREKRLSDTDALNRMHAFLDGEEWDSGTIEEVARLLARTGRTIREPEIEDDDMEDGDNDEA